MKYLQATEKKIICENPDSIFGYFGWPTVARMPGGALAMAASGFRLTHVCPFGKGIICYSFDEGNTWTRPAVVMDTPLDDRDCGLTVFGNGRVMLTSFNNTVAFQRRVNAKRDADFKALVDAYLDRVEKTDAEGKYLGSTYRVSEDGGFTFGKIGHSPVTAPHGPMRMNDGTLLYIGRRFSSDDSFDDGKMPFIECWRFTEADEWEKVSSIPNVSDAHGLLMSCEPHAIQLPDGKIVVHIRMQRGGEHREFTIYQSESTDGGHTFTAPHAILPALGGSPAHLLLHSDGTLLSVYGYREAPYGIRAMFSKDGGETWDTDWILDDTAVSPDLGYPATVELKDGRLLTVFYENSGECAVIKQMIWHLPK